MDVFLIGYERYDFALLRRALEAHSSVFCYDEPAACGALAGGASRVVFQIPRWTGELQTSTFYRGEKLLFLVREPREAVASIERTQLATDSAAYLRGRLEGDAGFCKQWGPETEWAERSQSRAWRSRRCTGSANRPRISGTPPPSCRCSWRGTRTWPGGPARRCAASAIF